MNDLVLENKKVKLTVNRKTGAITSFVIKNKKADVLDGEAGYIAVEDGLKKKIFDDRASAEIINLKITKEKDNIISLSFEKKYHDADFTVAEEILMFPEEIKWKASVCLEKGRSRTIQIYFVFPALRKDTHLFVSHSSAPLPPDQLDHRMYVYGGDMLRGELGDAVLLPLITMYHPGKDYGISLCHPVDNPKPQVQYFFARSRADMSCVIKYACLQLKENSAAQVSLDLVSHEGDWRCGLKYIRDKHPEYFQVEGKSIHKSEGAMLCSPALHAEQDVKAWKKYGFSWQELHSYLFPRSHFYVPEKNSWDSITQTAVNMRNLTLGTLSPISLFEFNHVLLNKPPAPEMSYQKIQDYIRLLHKNGVAAFIYLNPCLAIIEYAEEFPDSIARQENGRPFTGCYLSYIMNPDPEFSWGRNIIRQVKKILDILADVDGVFFDELHYRNFDFAHSDGVTMINNKLCYCLGLGMEKLAREICQMVHQRGKSVWANGPTSLEVMRHVDGFMAEGAEWWWLGSVQYLGLSKLLVALQQVRNPKEHEKTLKHCLMAGAQPSVPWRLEGERGIVGESKETKKVIPDTREEIKFLFQSYQPLLELMKGREWVLEPRALTLPAGVKGNIFKTGPNYVATIISMDKSLFDNKIKGEKIELEMEFHDAARLKEVFLLSADFKGKKAVKFIRTEKKIKITVPSHKTASLLFLTLT